MLTGEATHIDPAWGAYDRTTVGELTLRVLGCGLPVHRDLSGRVCAPAWVTYYVGGWVDPSAELALAARVGGAELVLALRGAWELGGRAAVDAVLKAAWR